MAPNHKHKTVQKLSTYLKVFKKRFMEEEEDEYEGYLKKLNIIKAYYEGRGQSLRL